MHHQNYQFGKDDDNIIRVISYERNIALRKIAYGYSIILVYKFHSEILHWILYIKKLRNIS